MCVCVCTGRIPTVVSHPGSWVGMTSDVFGTTPSQTKSVRLGDRGLWSFRMGVVGCARERRVLKGVGGVVCESRLDG